MFENKLSLIESFVDLYFNLVVQVLRLSKNQPIIRILNIVMDMVYDICNVHVKSVILSFEHYPKLNKFYLLLPKLYPKHAV